MARVHPAGDFAPPSSQDGADNSESARSRPESDASSAVSRLKAAVRSLVSQGTLAPAHSGLPQGPPFFQKGEDAGALDPDSWPSRVSNFAVLLGVVYNAVILPVRVAWLPPNGDLDAVWLIALCLDGLLLIDAVMSSRRGFREQGQKEMRMSEIRKRYCCKWASLTHRTLLIDVLSLAPIDLLELQLVGLRGSLRVNRLLLLPYAFTLQRSACEHVFGSNTSLVIHAMVMYCIFVHYAACGCWLLSPANDMTVDHVSNSTILPPNEMHVTSLGMQYLMSLHEALAMIAGASAAISQPSSPIEAAFRVVVLACSLLFFAYSVSLAGVIEQTASAHAFELQRTVQYVRRTLRFSHRLPPFYVQRALEYLEYKKLSSESQSRLCPFERRP